jgi:hypothetical protein
MMNLFKTSGVTNESRQVIAVSLRQSEHLISADLIRTRAGRSSSRSKSG